MALSQERYIKIKSSIASSSVGSRDFSGLVITDSNTVTDAPDALETSYNNGDILTLSKGEASLLFGSDTSNDIVKYINSYFSYVSPSGGVPLTIKIAKVLDSDGETNDAKILGAFNRIANKTNNFGAFSIVTQTSPSVDAIVSVANANAALGFAHLFSVSAYGTTGNYTAENMSSNLKNISGVVITYGGELISYTMLAWLAAIDYSAANSASNTMYKQFSVNSDDYEIIDSDSLANTLDAYKVNYIGRVNINGGDVTFYQRGFNSNGEDTAVYCNEMWLKSSITEKFFNLVLDIEKIPANSTGAAMVQNLVAETAKEGIRNGSILVEKSLDDIDRATIIQMAGGVVEAFDEVQVNGYYAYTYIEKVGTEFKASYNLIYAKGDAIRSVSGSNSLI